MEIIRLVEEKVLLVVEEVLKILEGGIDLRTYELALKKELDSLGCDILQVVLESLDKKLREDKERKKQWELVRREDRKTITTLFGQVTYKRTYYQHKKSKEYCYLVDEKAGYSPHVRISGNLKAELVEAATVMSYEGATIELSRHNPELKISRQTVASSVKTFSPKKEEERPEKRKVKILYVEADEDHVKIKGHKKKNMTKLAYIHEGVAEKPRRHLINARYFSTLKKSSDELWYEIAEYIALNYDLESIETIYLAGDGGKWIKVGLDYLYDAIFVLDKFHLNKQIKSATAHAKDLKAPLRKAIMGLNKKEAFKNLTEALNRTAEGARKKRIIDTAKYINNNWDGIVAQVEHPEVGCSAEGHVSHILAARMSSRPMAWSVAGAENMAQMRAIRANGDSVKEHYLAGQQKSPLIAELKDVVQKELKTLKHRKAVGKEYLYNMPLLNQANSFTAIALRGLNNKYAV